MSDRGKIVVNIIEQNIKQQEIDYFAHLDKHKAINLTSYYDTGRSVTTPTWFVKISNKVYLLTDPQSYKVKRIKQTGRVEVSPSTLQGKPLGEAIQAQARTLDNKEDQESIESVYKAMRKKYGLMLRIFTWIGRLRGRGYIDVAVEIWQ